MAPTPAAAGATCNNGNNRGRWQKNTVHMTDAAGDEGESEADSQGGHESETELVPEDIAMEHHTAYVAYQTAKDKYKAAGEDHGHDPRHPLLPAWRTAGLRALEMEVPRPERTGFTPEVIEISDNFKFGASRTHRYGRPPFPDGGGGRAVRGATFVQQASTELAGPHLRCRGAEGVLHEAFLEGLAS